MLTIFDNCGPMSYTSMCRPSMLYALFPEHWFILILKWQMHRSVNILAELTVWIHDDSVNYYAIYNCIKQITIFLYFLIIDRKKVYILVAGAINSIYLGRKFFYWKMRMTIIFMGFFVSVPDISRRDQYCTKER